MSLPDLYQQILLPSGVQSLTHQGRNLRRSASTKRVNPHDTQGVNLDYII
jgi:hypothetical protein